jgi:tetratricopeptide (TPR) repeat protein
MLAMVAATAAVAPVLAQGAGAPPATPPGDPNGWVRELAIADKLAAAGYLDAAQKDYESIIQRYPSTVAGVDRAWVGLARIHLARFQFDQAKASMEEVLTRNSDAESVGAARGMYRQLKLEADGQLAQAMRAVQFMEYRFAMTPWFNVFAKLFAWLDLRNARKQAQRAAEHANGFDPHHLIELPAPSATATYAIAAADFAPAGSVTRPATGTVVSVHSPAPAASPWAMPSPAAAASAAIGAGVVPVAAAASPQPAPSAAGALASGTSGTGTQPDLLTLQRGYQAAYRTLQEAMTSGNQARVQEANAAYQAALSEYQKAAAAGRR